MTDITDHHDEGAPCDLCNINNLRDRASEYQAALDEAIRQWCGPNHKPVQHRDGKPAWCRECGFRADGYRAHQ